MSGPALPQSPQPPQPPQPWACTVCGQIIQPPGNPGKVDIEGAHYCNACAELAVLASPESTGSATRIAPARRSSAGPRPTRRASTAMTTPHRMPGSDKGPAIPAWVNLLKPLIILGLLGGFGYWIVVKKLKGEPEPAPPAVASSEQPTSAPSSAPKPEKKAPAKVASSPRPAPIRSERTDPAVQPPDVPDQAPVSVTPPAPEVTENDLVAGLERAAKMLKDFRYGTTQKLLRELSDRHARKDWWASHEKEWTARNTEFQQQFKEFQDEVREAREKLQGKVSPEAIEQLAGTWRTHAASEDELVAEQAKEVLRDAARARLKNLEETRAAHLREVETNLTRFENAMKSHPSAQQQEEILKLLTALDDEVLDNPACEERLAPRVQGLRFDVQRARDGDLMFYRAAVRMQGSSAELLYDFGNARQLVAWNYNSPEKGAGAASRATWDAGKKAVVLCSSGMHDWKKKERQGMPFLALPLDFLPLALSVEADVDIQELGADADVGLLFWEGGANVLFFGVREAADKTGTKEWLFKADGCLGKLEAFQKDLARIPAPKARSVKLQMVCSEGMLNFGAAVGGQTLAIQPRVHLPFKQNFIGLYVRTRSGENSVASFDNVKIAGTPDFAALRNKADLARQMQVNSAKDEWRKEAQAARVARDEAAGALRKDWFVDWQCATAQPCAAFPDRPNARTTSPTKPNTTPCWKQRVKLEPQKAHYLHADVGAPQDVDWSMDVRVNGKAIFNRVVAGPDWQMVDVDLTAYGGEEVLLEIANGPTGKEDGETAYWDRIYVGHR